MTRKLVVSMLAAAVVGLAAGVEAGQSGSAPSPAKRTIWDGVYTDAQAQRGELVYRERCGFCHRLDLSAGELGRSLKGPSFLGRWEGPLAHLYLKIGVTMPHNAPTVLPPAAAVDIVAHILKMNGASPGKSELPSNEALEQIAVTK